MAMGTTPLSAVMRRLLTGYARQCNRRHKRRGRLCQDRYKSFLCEKEPYFLELVRYTHLTPLRAGIVRSRRRRFGSRMEEPEKVRPPRFPRRAYSRQQPVCRLSAQESRRGASKERQGQRSREGCESEQQTPTRLLFEGKARELAHGGGDASPNNSRAGQLIRRVPQRSAAITRNTGSLARKNMPAFAEWSPKEYCFERLYVGNPRFRYGARQWQGWKNLRERACNKTLDV